MSKCDLTGHWVRIDCIAGCRRSGVAATLQRDPSPLVTATGQNQPFAGHIAICAACGTEAIDFYNWVALDTPPNRRKRQISAVVTRNELADATQAEQEASDTRGR